MVMMLGFSSDHHGRPVYHAAVNTCSPRFSRAISTATLVALVAAYITVTKAVPARNVEPSRIRTSSLRSQAFAGNVAVMRTQFMLAVEIRTVPSEPSSFGDPRIPE